MVDRSLGHGVRPHGAQNTPQQPQMVFLGAACAAVPEFLSCFTRQANVHMLSSAMSAMAAWFTVGASVITNIMRPYSEYSYGIVCLEYAAK